MAVKSTAFGNVLAVEACRRVRHWLPVAVKSGQDLEARGEMLFAAMLSGCVIAQSGTTLVHGLGYHLTLEFGVPHGLANGVLLAPAVSVITPGTPPRKSRRWPPPWAIPPNRRQQTPEKIVAALYAFSCRPGRLACRPRPRRRP